MKSKELRWAAGLATAGVLAGAALVWLPRASDDPDASVVEAGLPGAVVGDLRAAFEDRQMPSLSGNWTLSLPEDHAPHPEAPAETWAIFAHLRDADGAPVSALFTLSRFGIATEPDDTGNAWAPRDAWLGQAAIVGDRAQAEERLSRGAGAAGQDAGAGRVWLDDWSIDHRHEAGSDRVTLRARVEGTALELTSGDPFALPPGVYVLEVTHPDFQSQRLVFGVDAEDSVHVVVDLTTDRPNRRTRVR